VPEEAKFTNGPVLAFCVSGEDRWLALLSADAFLTRLPTVPGFNDNLLAPRDTGVVEPLPLAFEGVAVVVLVSGAPPMLGPLMEPRFCGADFEGGGPMDPGRATDAGRRDVEVVRLEIVGVCVRGVLGPEDDGVEMWPRVTEAGRLGL
jgi:hypothetical protein